MARTFNSWGVPIGIATSIFGGNAWLNRLHLSVESVQERTFSLEKDIVMNRDVSQLRLSRMEKKLDSLLALMNSGSHREKR